MAKGRLSDYLMGGESGATSFGGASRSGGGARSQAVSGGAPAAAPAGAPAPARTPAQQRQYVKEWGLSLLSPSGADRVRTGVQQAKTRARERIGEERMDRWRSMAAGYRSR